MEACDSFQCWVANSAERCLLILGVHVPVDMCRFRLRGVHLLVFPVVHLFVCCTCFVRVICCCSALLAYNISCDSRWNLMQ
jgi:hypothetical protein